MIDPCKLSYDEWLTVSASYKTYEAGGQSIEFWLNWCSPYPDDDQRADTATWNSLTGEGITKGTLIKFAKEHSPMEFGSYVQSLHPRNNAPSWKQKKKETLQPWGNITENHRKNQLQKPVFPLGVFPNIIETFISSATAYQQVDRAMIGSAVLTAGALAGQGRFSVYHPSGNGFSEELCLFTAISAEPGERKTGCLKIVLKPITEYISQQTASYNQSHKETERNLTLFANRKSRLNKNYASLGDTDSDRETKETIQNELRRIENMEESLISALPVNPNILMQDTTTEGMIQKMETTSGNIGLFTDESDFFKIWSGLYNDKGSNLAVLLQAYDRTGIKVDRRNGIHDIPFTALTICAFVQPTLLNMLLANGDFSGRGLVGRFLISIPESHVGRIDHRNNSRLDESATQAYSDILTTIMKHEYAPQSLPLSWSTEDNAIDFAIDYMNSLERKMLQGGTLENFKDYGSKSAGRYLRICGILHLMKYPSDPLHHLLDADTARKASVLSNYFIRQAEIIADNRENADDKIEDFLESAIIELAQNGTTTVGDVWRKVHKKKLNGSFAFPNRETLHEFLSDIEADAKIQILKNGKKETIHINPNWKKNP